MLRTQRGAFFLVLLTLLALGSAAKKKKSEVVDELLYLTDSTLEAALETNQLMLISVNVRPAWSPQLRAIPRLEDHLLRPASTLQVPGCDVCDQLARKLRLAAAELRVKGKGAVTLGELKIESQDSPVLAKIVQGQVRGGEKDGPLATLYTLSLSGRLHHPWPRRCEDSTRWSG